MSESLLVDLGGGAHALFTTRSGGVSDWPYESLNLGRTVPDGDTDDPVAIESNRDRVAAAVGLPRACFEAGHQVHGTAVRTVDVANGWPVATLPHVGDGVATRQAGLAAVVLVADCLPVALASRSGVAMVHAGWRGLAGGVLENAVAALGGVGAVRAAAIGPGIGPCCFEVGNEVRDAFAAYPQARAGRRNLDLKAIARTRLEAAGVGEICDLGRCTACEPDEFFSHRRDGPRTGRQAGVAWRAN